MNARFHPDAIAEVQAARNWYAAHAEDVGDQFLTAIDEALDRIQRNPDAYPIFESGTRRFLLPKFPFSIIYRAEEGLEVVAVMHERRRPQYWINRSASED